MTIRGLEDEDGVDAPWNRRMEEGKTMTEPKKSRQLVTLAEKAGTLRELLVSRRSELRAALPRHLSADRILRLVMTAVAKNPKLLECTQASIYSAVLQCAQLGLEPDLLGQAYLVPFRNTKKNAMEVQLIPGYLGLLTLARRSGQIASVEARVVREGDHFGYSYGLKSELFHRPNQEATGKLTHAYAIARYLHGGEPSWEVMPKSEIETHRARSRAANSGPWVTDYNAMCLKTVLRKLCKLLPSSVELQTAVALDEAAEAGIPQDLPPLGDAGDSETIPDEKRPDAKAAAPTSSDAPAGATATTPVVDCGCPDAPNDVHVEGCSKIGQTKLL